MRDNFVPAGSFNGGPLQLPTGIVTDEGEWLRTLELREMTGDEEELFMNRQHSRDGDTTTQVLKRCVTAIGDIKDAGQIGLLLDRLPMADATLVLVRLRQLSLGDELSFGCRCPVKACQHTNRYVINLNGREVSYRPEKRVVGTGDDAVEIDMRPKSSYTAELRPGLDVEFRMLTTKDQPQLTACKRDEPEKLDTFSMYLSLVTINGKKPRSMHEISKWPSRDRARLRGELDAMEYGVDAIVENTCKACGTMFNQALPIGDKDFFFPSVRRNS